MTEADMREPTFWLLTALTEGPQHGYALLQAIDRLSDGRVRLRPGSLYGMLDRLAALGLVEDTGTERSMAGTAGAMLTAPCGAQTPEGGPVRDRRGGRS